MSDYYINDIVHCTFLKYLIIGPFTYQHFNPVSINVNKYTPP